VERRANKLMVGFEIAEENNVEGTIFNTNVEEEENWT
jgi:hypothetical protein